MENNQEFNSISKYYDNLVDQFGHDPRSCDYGHSNSQIIKFNVLSDFFDHSNAKILDIGCGFADYYKYLTNKFPNVDYHGVDISKKMITTANKLYPNLDLQLRNVFENPFDYKFDIVTSNGIFYLLGENSLSIMKEYIIKMFEMTNNVLVFNSLSTFATDQEKSEFYANPLEIFNFCKSLTEWVTLRHDYHPRDFTIYMYKNRNI